MKTMKLIIGIALACCASLGFMSAKNDVTKEQLAADRWMLKTINNRPASELFTYRLPYLMFNLDLEQVSGGSGCNSFTGKYNYGGGELKMFNFQSGEIACPGMSDEELFMSLLGKTSKLSLMNGELIFSQDDKPVMVFFRTQPLTSADLAGVWRLQSLDGKNIGSDFGDMMPTLEFDFANNRISGNTGCNAYTTTYTLARNVLEVNPIISTRMTCDNAKGEEKFVKLFTGRMDIDMENGELVVRKDNKVILTFKK